MGKALRLCNPHGMIFMLKREHFGGIQLHALIHTELLEPLSRGAVGRLFSATKSISIIQ